MVILLLSGFRPPTIGALTAHPKNPPQPSALATVKRRVRTKRLLARAAASPPFLAALLATQSRCLTGTAAGSYVPIVKAGRRLDAAGKEATSPARHWVRRGERQVRQRGAIALSRSAKSDNCTGDVGRRRSSRPLAARQKAI